MQVPTLLIYHKLKITESFTDEIKMARNLYITYLLAKFIFPQESVDYNNIERLSELLKIIMNEDTDYETKNNALKNFKILIYDVHSPIHIGQDMIEEQYNLLMETNQNIKYSDLDSCFIVGFEAEQEDNRW